MPYQMSATKRANTGRRARTELKERRIPAVIYGHGIATQSIAVPQSDFLKLFKLAGYSSLIDLTVENQPAVKVVIKDLQVNPLNMTPRHVDFHQIRMDEEMTVQIPLKFVGESKAVKVDGGTLVKSLDEIEVRCLPANLPHEIEVDLSALTNFEDAITIKSLRLPAGVTANEDETITIATVARPLTEDELKKLEQGETADIAAIKTEGEEKKAAEEAKKAAEAAVEAA